MYLYNAKTYGANPIKDGHYSQLTLKTQTSYNSDVLHRLL